MLNGIAQLLAPLSESSMAHKQEKWAQLLHFLKWGD